MEKVVGVRFKRAGKIYYFSPLDLDIAMGDAVIVETARGMEYGTVVAGPKEVTLTESMSPLKSVLRKATQQDKDIHLENQAREKEAFRLCQQKIHEHKMAMKLVEVEYTFDMSKIIFYFTAEGRVDFRDLVKDLAAIFRTRIELRQIGVRDEAKMLGGLGSCGRVLCCHTMLGDFQPVSIRMAKQQNLSLNPTKISGICGRLMCCLKYESDDYERRDSGRGEKQAGKGADKGRGDRTPGEKIPGDKTEADTIRTDTIQADPSPADKTPADKIPAERNPGGRGQGERSQGDRGQGNRSQGDRGQGNRGQGGRGHGDRGRGDRGHGDRGQDKGKACPGTADKE